MRGPDRLEVFMDNRHVGTMAETNDGLMAFQYDDAWIATGFSLNPLSLPLQRRVFVPKYEPFEGLFGVFCDSLPDGWGRLVMDRFIRRELNMSSDQTSKSLRLSFVADSGMGALTYRPSFDHREESLSPNAQVLDHLSAECHKLLNDDFPEDLDALVALGGSSGGARPKIMTTIDGEHWIIKFPSGYDPDDIGEQEYRYSQCARACGIEMAETRLFESQRCSGYFGTKRFDRVMQDGHTTKVHTVSASGILETSHRIPNLDYHQLFRLTFLLTEDYRELSKLFDRMCFNVFAHNRDDHSKNFSFLFDEVTGRWKLTPAYDLTYSNSIGGEHATTINGEGRTPGVEHILAVAKSAGLNVRNAKLRAEEIHEIVLDNLGRYLTE